MESTLRPNRIRRVRRLLGMLGVTAAVLYGVAILFLMWRETQLVFFPGDRGAGPRAGLSIEVTRVEYTSAAGWRQLAIEVAPVEANRPDATDVWMIFFHGNGGSVWAGASRYAQLRGLGIRVLAPEYTGYGEMPGTPSEKALAADALAAYRYLRDQRGVAANRIVLYGWSLGSCVAVDLGSRVEAAGLVLEGAIASVVQSAARRYPAFPVRLLMRNRFEAEKRIGFVRAPVLFIHSPDDQQVPIADARRLHALTRAPRQFLELRGGHQRAHLVDETAYLEGLASFLRDRAGLSVGAAGRR